MFRSTFRKENSHRQIILDVLKNENRSRPGESVGIIRISELTQLNVTEIDRAILYLIGQEELEYDPISADQQFVYISTKGLSSWSDRKYDRAIDEKRIVNIQMLIAIISVIISFATFLYTIRTNSNLEQRIMKLENQINSNQHKNK